MATLEEKLRWAEEEFRAQVREERFAYASLTWLIGKVCKKALKGKDAVTIANELEEDDVERGRESWMWQNRLLQTMMWKKSIKR